MSKKILIPLDGSKCAEAILPYIEIIFNDSDIELIFLTVVEKKIVYITPVGSFGHIAEFEQKRRRALIAKAKAYLSQVETKYNRVGIPAQAVVEEGTIVSTIVRIAKMEKADMIAMASRGLTSLGQVYYGSVATNVLHRAHCPLLVVRCIN